MKVKKFLGICLDGYPFAAAFLAVALAGVFFHWLWLSIPFGIVTLWCLWFFRDPERHFAGAPHEIVCPADGKIIADQEVDYPYLLEGRARRISIFMNIFNVHVNRAPLDGKVLATEYHKGSFLGAFHEKASLENEQTGVLLDHGGKKILFVQIAGLIARRVVCRTGQGDELKRGERFGLIRFGSRVDVYLPLTASVSVKLNDKVYAGRTKLGEI